MANSKNLATKKKSSSSSLTSSKKSSFKFVNDALEEKPQSMEKREDDKFDKLFEFLLSDKFCPRQNTGAKCLR